MFFYKDWKQKLFILYPDPVTENEAKTDINLTKKLLNLLIKY